MHVLHYFHGIACEQGTLENGNVAAEAELSWHADYKFGAIEKVRNNTRACALMHIKPPSPQNLQGGG